MKALVTGGTGFVGSHVARVLAAEGHEVRVLHRTTSRLDALQDVPFESALGDITDLTALRAASEGCDWVFHVAAVADYWRADKKRMFEANVEGKRRVLQAAAETGGVKRVVFTSSSAAMGVRSDGKLVDESVRFNLSSTRFPYGYSKALAEVAVREAVIRRGQDVVIVNPVVVMGPGDLNIISGDFVLRVKQLGWALPIPPGVIAVTDVRDIARWHIAAAERGQTGERYLLGTANYPYYEWFALIAEEVGAPQPGFLLPRFALPLVASVIDAAQRAGIKLPIDGNQARLGAANYHYDFSKTWGELGEPQISMRQSVRDTYLWYMEHGYLRPNPLPQFFRRG